MQKKYFIDYLTELNIGSSEILIVKFENLLKALEEENKIVNLISRKMLIEDFWTVHFLDSILPVKHFHFTNQRILDFGTGGGLPGIPLNILYPKLEVFLLDSKKKKIEAIKNIIKSLDLINSHPICSRLEEMTAKKWQNSFDIIICRSVKILPKYKKTLFSLLKKDGKILLYKSKILDDADLFQEKKIISMNHPAIGERNLVVISK